MSPKLSQTIRPGFILRAQPRTYLKRIIFNKNLKSTSKRTGHCLTTACNLNILTHNILKKSLRM